MKLTKEIASNITEKMMAAIPYNINIMDELGIIIASGDKKRIGTIHRGAIEAIQKGSMVSISDHSSSIKPGVNMPIMFHDKIIGVIGITGNLDIVEPFASLVKGSAELLVSQEYSFNERRVQEQVREEFIFRWIYQREEYKHDFVSQGKDLGIDITKPRRILYIEDMEKNKLKFGHLANEEYVVSLDHNTNIVLLLDNTGVVDRAAQVIDNIPLIAGLGEPDILIRNSLRQARKTVAIARTFKIKNKIVQFKSVSYIDRATKSEGDKRLLEIFEELSGTEKGIDLLDTLESYILNDGEVIKIAKQLHIHRNSLGYRLSKIEEITGLNPRIYTELYQLITSFIQYKMGG